MARYKLNWANVLPILTIGCGLVLVGLGFALAGCAAPSPNQTVEQQAIGAGYIDPPPGGYLYVGDKNSFIVYYPNCPLVDNIPPANLRYYTEVPRWHRLDTTCGGPPDPCDDVVCSNGLVCIDGICVDPCEGVVCPDGWACSNGLCIDPCEGIDCGDGFVCSNGECLPDEESAQSFMTGPIGWNDGITVQPSIPIHPKDLDGDGDIDMKDFQIAQAIGTWEVSHVDWEDWPYMTFYIKSNFRYNGDNWSMIDDQVVPPQMVELRAYVLELPFGWVWQSRVLCTGNYVYRNSLLYGKTFEDASVATRHYYGTKAENWTDAGELTMLPKPTVGSGLTCSVKELFRYTVYPEWLVTFTGDDKNGIPHTDACVKGVSLSRDGWELMLEADTNGFEYIPVEFSAQIHIAE